MNWKVLVLIIFSVTSCEVERKFDASAWKTATGESMLTNVRESMISDILESDLFLDKSISEIESLLGADYYMTDSSMRYPVREKYGSNIDPIYIKRLHVLIGNNGISERLICEKIK